MKRIFLLAVLAVTISFFITIFLKKDIDNFKYYQNNYVRVKTNTSVINVSLEEYVLGVIAGEMPYEFNIEALKAQAVAVRTYVLNKKNQRKNLDYDVTNTTSDQVFYTLDQLKNIWENNYYKKIIKFKKAVDDTSGLYITYNNIIIEAFYFSTSCGKTEYSGEVFQKQLPYLVSVDSSWDSISPNYIKYYTFNISEFFEKLKITKTNIINIKILEQTSTGRIKKISIDDNIFTGSEFITLLGIKSTYFSINQVDTFIYISSKGYGHGVGMSQYGAQAMSLNGYKYNEILSHYYKNTELKKL